MNEEQVRKIIRDELKSLLATDRVTFQKHLQIFDARNVQVGKTNGTIIATEGGTSGQKLGFFGKTPVTQPSTVADPSGGGVAGVDLPARGAINSIIDSLQSLGLMQ